jgi:hypothetical protein
VVDWPGIVAAEVKLMAIPLPLVAKEAAPTFRVSVRMVSWPRPVSTRTSLPSSINPSPSSSAPFAVSPAASRIS